MPGLPPITPSAKERFRAVAAIASPARQEVVSELAEGPASVKELSARLGRSRQALHFHIAALVRAGVLAQDGTRGEGRSAEAIYRVNPAMTDLRSPEDLSNSERKAAGRAAGAMLRLTQREMRDALARVGRGEAPEIPMVAIRAKGRLDRAGVLEVQSMVWKLVEIFRKAKGKHPDEPALALTLVLTPARESGVTRQRPRKKTRRKKE